MNFKVDVEVSNHHVHLTKEDYDKLFDTPYTKIKDLSQTGEFVSDKIVNVKTPNGQITRLRVLLPFRNYTQVELSKSDSYLLHINPPICKSGDLSNASNITIFSDKGEINGNFAIIQEAHIHMNENDLIKYKVNNDQEVMVHLKSENREGLIKAHIKSSVNGVMKLHIDFDEANAFCQKNDMKADVIVCGK